jgi:FAD/FMN-containing dehydrogenase
MPAIVVEAASVEDVQATVTFARRNKVRLTVKNGGHSYMGYCLNEGGIVLDLAGMKGCLIDPDNMTIKMEGGLIWKEAYYKYREDPSLIVVGGQCPTVGVSGFTLGGGLSPFSRSYGLACDNLLEMTIVTYDGKVVTVSRDDKDEKKQDLFWALTGGGGGNFGVTVSMTCKIHKLRDPDGIVVCGQLSWNFPQQKDDFDQMMECFNTTKCPDELTVDALWSHGTGKQLTGSMLVIYNGGWDAAQRALKHILRFKPAKNTLKPMRWTEWVRTAEGWDTFSQVYHHHASFIFAEGAVTRDLNTKISALVAEAVQLLGITDENGPNDPKCHILWDHIGAATSRIGPEDTAFYWRKGDYASTIKVQWTDPSQGPKMMDFIAKCQSVLLPYAIEQKAAYLNYIDGTVPNWQEAYYGRNYPRLQKVKTEWDPQNFFWNMQSIEPLADGTKARTIHDVLAVPRKHEILSLPEAQKVRGWWDHYAPLVTPDMLGSPGTEEEVYEKDAAIHQHILKG